MRLFGQKYFLKFFTFAFYFYFKGVKTTNINIRNITKNDKEQFLEMSRRFYSSDAVLHNIDESCHLATFSEIMRSDELAECFIIEAEGKAAGYALLAKTFSREAGGAVVWIEELYFEPQYRGKGIGTAVFKWIEENRPAARYRLEVEPENVAAKRLYKRLGYDVLPYEQMIKEK